MTKKIRLDKLIANMGAGSRREVKMMIKEGAVTVNDIVATDSGMHIAPQSDIVKISGEPLEYKQYMYIMLNKPAGVITATEDDRQKTVLDLLDASVQKRGLFPVGRLDKDTVGLLLLTDNGKLAHQLLSPKHHVDKTYFAEVAGKVEEDDIIHFKSGVTLDDGYTTLPAELRIKHREETEHGIVSHVEIVIKEGKYHQIKRMFAAVGKKVLFLKRLAMGPLRLDERLQLGQYRELTHDEVKRLQTLD